MRTIWHSLIWKEWHEHKWKLVGVAVILLALAAITSFSADREQDAAELSIGIALLCAVPLTICIAADDSTGERSRGTLPFLQALPIPRQKIAVQKLVFGLATCLLPIVLTILSAHLWRFLRHLIVGSTGQPLVNWFGATNASEQLFWVAELTIAVCLVVSLFLWTAALSVNRKDEVSGAAWASATMAGLWAAYAFICVIVIGRERSAKEPWMMAERIVASSLPGGFSHVIADFGSKSLPRSIASAAVAIVVHLAVLFSFVTRFAGQPTARFVSPGPTIVRGGVQSLAPPRRSQWTAIVWKQLREMGPALVTGIAAMFCLAIGGLILDGPDVSDSHQFALMISILASYVGFVVTLTIGIGVFLNDLSPKLNTFWRSRPIDPNRWFWVRFCTVPIILIATFALPGMIAAWWASFPTDAKPYSPWAGVFTAVSTYVALYATSIALTCLVRRPIYAAVLSIGALVMPYLIIWNLWLGAARYGIVEAPRSGPVDSLPPTAAFAVLGLVAFSAMLTGWLAVRNDWGRKS
jgi:hypothetical protein